MRRDGRAVECTGLENRHTLIAYLGFESLSLRHYIERTQYNGGKIAFENPLFEKFFWKEF